jgi:hypothetical protein
MKQFAINATFSIGGGLVGAILLTVLTFVFDSQFRPNLTKGDYYGWFVFLTGPTGLLLGGATALALQRCGVKKYASAGATCFFSGILSFLIPEILTGGSFYIDTFRDLHDSSFGQILSGLWTVSLILAGCWLLYKGSDQGT